ncbi:MAG: hypothetical protein GXY92_02970 [Syntrophomonadaceae bacterium]|nr:hypothetical protein [Syntrophomonadaceae bacterium]
MDRLEKVKYILDQVPVKIKWVNSRIVFSNLKQLDNWLRLMAAERI